MRKLITIVLLSIFFAPMMLSGCSYLTESTKDEPEETLAQQQTEFSTIIAESITVTESTTSINIDDSSSDLTESPTEYVFQWVKSNPDDCYDATGFVSVDQVIPDVVLDIRYYTDYNFVGTRINGYEEPLALLSEEAAFALRNAADSLREEGYLIKIFDAYRPQRAVEHFATWASDWNDTKMKEVFYPSVDKSMLFEYGYIAYYSGHSRGSKVDLTLIDAKSGKELDMGGSFDFFDISSHPDYTNISTEQYNNRMILRKAMLNNGFSPCSTEWWDFTLDNEPYPYTYFDFPVSSSSLYSKNQGE